MACMRDGLSIPGIHCTAGLFCHVSNLQMFAFLPAHTIYFLYHLFTSDINIMVEYPLFHRTLKFYYNIWGIRNIFAQIIFLLKFL